MIIQVFAEAYESPVNEYVRGCSKVVKFVLFVIFSEIRMHLKPVEV
jgi:hypothetical protein